MTAVHVRPFTVTLIMVATVLTLMVFYVVTRGVRSVGAGLFLSGMAVFFLMKGAFAWWIRRRAATPQLGLLSDRQFRWLAAGYFVAAGFFISAAALGYQRLWSWALVIGAAALGWMYFVASRHEIE